MKAKILGLLAVNLLAGPMSAQATVTQSFGSGSAVTSIDATADFEDVASLGVSYSENGMTFTRVGISSNNNGCGFAGCSSAFAPYGFVGNYFYGADDGNVFPESYVQIAANGGNVFAALEFLFGWGPNNHSFYWEAFLSGNLVGSGNGVSGPGTVLGLSSSGGFDVVRFTDSAFTASLLTSPSGGVSPAIDSVKAQFSSVPEPGTLALLGLGLAGLGLSRRRRAN